MPVRHRTGGDEPPGRRKKPAPGLSHLFCPHRLQKDKDLQLNSKGEGMAKADTRVLFVNGTLKPSPETSNTEGLWKKAKSLFEEQGAATEEIRLADMNIKFGVTSDEGEGDEWPQVLERIRAADVVVVGSPIWMGHISSIAKMFLERLRGVKKADKDPETGQYLTYGKAGVVLITGNEDGAHATAALIEYQLARCGFTIPPHADAYWVGEAGPGPSYLEAGGERHLFTNKSLRYLVHNSLHLVRTLRAAPYPTNLKALGEEAEKESD